MQIQTKAYGKINVDDRQKIFFPYGILGFETLKDYVLLDAAQPPFYWLQSLDIPEIAFVMIDPYVFRKDFSLDVMDEDLESIDVNKKDKSNLLIFSIVTIPENHREMSANLQGPIVINKDTRQGRQCISVETKWKVKHYIMEELVNREEANADSL